VALPARSRSITFSLLRSIENLFGLGHLGYAGGPGVTAFEPALFSARKR